MSIKVALFPKEIKNCDFWAVKRYEERIAAGKEAKLRSHEVGCYGEYAVVKHYKCEWVGRYYEGELWRDRGWDTEVGEVRATFNPDSYNGMKLYPKDDWPDAPYIWVTLRRQGSYIKAQLVGWIIWKDGIRDEWWNEEGCWVVPRDELHHMEQLPNNSILEPEK